MTVTTLYSQATTSVTTAPHTNAANNNTSQWDGVGGSYSNRTTSGSESSSSDDGGAKKKRRSHRPRGCRGGGSRRARKERRELQFLTQKRDNGNNLSTTIPFLPPMNNQAPTKSQQQQQQQDPAFQLQNMQLPNECFSRVFHKRMDFVPALPALQSSSSFSSSGSSEGGSNPDPYLHTNYVPYMSNNFDILPCMPPVQTATNFSAGSGSNYQSMSALPPLHPARVSTHNHLETQKQYTNKHVGFTSDTKPPSFPVTVAPRGETFTYNNNANIIRDNNNHTTSYHTERIKIQQDMLAGGGSLFATSPRSFLLGAKKAPCFF